MAAGRWSGPSRHQRSARRAAERAPLAIGWGVREQATRGEVVVGAFERDQLSEGLARLHGQGFGPAARVLDGAHGDLTGQAGRAGLQVELVDRLVPADRRRTTVLLVVHAPARGAQVADLLGGAGALVVEVIDPARPTFAPLPVEPEAPPLEHGL
jgi:hypothetical protein